MTGPTKPRSGWGQIKAGAVHYFPPDGIGRSLCGRHEAEAVAAWKVAAWKVSGGFRGFCAKCDKLHAKRTGRA